MQDFFKYKLKDILSILKGSERYVWILAISICLESALLPFSAYISKPIIKDFKSGNIDVGDLILNYGSIFLIFSIILLVLNFITKVTKEVLDVRVIIKLQKEYLKRETKADASKDASNILYGAHNAKDALQVIYKEIWYIGSQIFFVLVWQYTLDVRFIPFLILSIIPSIFFVIYLGDKLKKGSFAIYEKQESLIMNSKRELANEFSKEQDYLYYLTVRFEILRWVFKEITTAIMWLCFITLFLTIYYFELYDFSNSDNMANIVAFFINFQILLKPLSKIGKTYSGWCKSSPVLYSVLCHK